MKKGRLLLTSIVALVSIGIVNKRNVVVNAEETQTYSKVTDATLNDYSGTYLIVCEAEKVLFDGSISSNLDVASNNIKIENTLNAGKGFITGNYADSTFSFEKVPNTDTYTIKSKSGIYIGRTSNSNGLESSSTNEYKNTVSISSGNAVIGMSGTTLRYNKSSGQYRFRYYKTGQTAIQLYKLDAPVAKEDEVTIKYNVDGGTPITNSVVTKGEGITSPKEPTKDGYIFGGWYTTSSFDTLYTFGDAINEDIELFAKWNDYEESSVEEFETGDKPYYRIKGEVISKYSDDEYLISSNGKSIKVKDNLNNFKGVSVGNDITLTLKKKDKVNGVLSASDVHHVVIKDVNDDKIDLAPITDINDIDGVGEYVSLSNIKLSIGSSDTKHVEYRSEDELFLISANYEYTDGVTSSTKEVFMDKFVNVKGFVEYTGSYYKIYASSITSCNSHRVSFNTMGGNNIDSIEVLDGDKLDLPNDPTKESTNNTKYKFDTWYLDRECTQEFDLDSLITSDITLYAKWIESPIGVEERIGNVSNKVALEFDYDIRTHYLDNGVSYENCPLDKIDTLGALFTGTGSYSTSNGYYQLKDDGRDITYEIENGYAGPIGIKFDAAATGNEGAPLSTLRVVTWRQATPEDLDSEKVDAKGRYILTTRNVELSLVSNTYEYVIEHLGSATNVSIIVDKVSGSNVRVYSLSLGKNVQVTNENIHNVKLTYSYNFDVTNENNLGEIGFMVAYGDEAGLYLTEDGLTSYNESLVKYVNENKDAKFTISLDINDLLDMYDQDIYVATYVKTLDNKYYYGDISTHSVEEIITKYQEMELSDELSNLLVLFSNHIDSLLA